MESPLIRGNWLCSSAYLGFCYEVGPIYEYPFIKWPLFRVGMAMFHDKDTISSNTVYI